MSSAFDLRATPAATRQSAVIVRVALPPALAAVRDRWDRAAQLGVPPHVTILYPFVPRALLGDAVRAALVGAIADVRSFPVRFVDVGRWPGILYLVPEQPAPFTALIDLVTARWPDYPPYEGTVDEVVPHCTLVENADAPLDELADEAARALPVDDHARALEVIVEGPDGGWTRGWRLRLRP